MLIGYFLYKESVSTRTYLTLIPICVGVGVSCYNDDIFNMIGFLLAYGSNICFSLRAVLAKKLIMRHSNKIDEMNLFYFISITGMLILIPTTIVLESWKIITIYSSMNSVSNKIFHVFDGNNTRGTIIDSNIKFESGDIVVYVNPEHSPRTLLETSADVLSSKTNVVKDSLGDNSSYNMFIVLLLFTVNGIGFATYNLLSYIVLKRTDLVTHSVLNVFRRVVIILFTVCYFHVKFQFLNVFGIILASVGVVVFGISKSSDKSSLLLPFAQRDA